jgi:hypothetical protein
MKEYLDSIDHPLYIGKETIELKHTRFFEDLPYVKRALKGCSEEDLQQLRPFKLNCVHGDHVEVLPSTSSSQTPIWKGMRRISI